MRRASKTGSAVGVLSQQIDALHNDLLAFAAKTERRFDQIDRRFDRLDLKLDLAGDGLTTGLRRIVGNAVRQAFRERRKKC